MLLHTRHTAVALAALDVSRVGLGDVLDGLVQVGLLHAHAVHAAAQLVDLDGAGVELHAQPGGGLGRILAHHNVQCPLRLPHPLGCVAGHCQNIKFSTAAHLS